MIRSLHENAYIYILCTIMSVNHQKQDYIVYTERAQTMHIITTYNTEVPMYVRIMKVM